MEAAFEQHLKLCLKWGGWVGWRWLEGGREGKGGRMEAERGVLFGVKQLVSIGVRACNTSMATELAADCVSGHLGQHANTAPTR